MDLSQFEKDNRVNCRIESKVPPKSKEEPCWLGIDEAGRGPVLGPMVYGICFSPLSMKDELKAMGFADSKTLTEEKREAMFEAISKAEETIGWIVDILAPNYISNSMLKRTKYNLNALSHDTAIGMIQRALDMGANIKEVYVDTVGDPGKYQDKLKGIYPQLDITVAKKADATYSIVSAASICAKVARDRSVKGWQFLEALPDIANLDYGSGYPGDEKTKNFLRSSLDPVFGFPGFVRFSWSTASSILDDKAVPVFWEDDEDEDEKKGKDLKGVPAITSFFGAKADKSQVDLTKRHQYFKDRCLEHVMEF